MHPSVSTKDTIYSKRHNILLTAGLTTNKKSKKVKKYTHSRSQNQDSAALLLQAGYCAWGYSSHCRCRCQLRWPPAHWRTLQQDGMLSSSCLWLSRALWLCSRRETYQQCLMGNLQGKASGQFSVMTKFIYSC